MAESLDWAFPVELQPSARTLGFDLQRALDAVVMLRAEIPEDAFTASILGTERTGSAVVIRDDGLLLTIGYLILNSTFLPKVLGVLMIAGGFGWITFFLPSLANRLMPFNMLPGILGEASLTLWLLAAGVNVQRWRESATRASNAALLSATYFL